MRIALQTSQHFFVILMPGRINDAEKGKGVLRGILDILFSTRRNKDKLAGAYIGELVPNVHFARTSENVVDL